ncbi:hypothetical protein [Nocardia miyunensis]|uniref:hypothetical protein n=1 Tax=Nocardia miyunensis TaxID=282684 RepID=UPI000A024191
MAVQGITGDRYGLTLPAHPEELRRSGAGFLTRAFRAAGSLAADNAVADVTEFREVRGGSTGRKALLSVRYRNLEPHLHTNLFVKFSRDLDDPLRDRGRTQMEPEVRLAELAACAQFPITVPTTYFGDYHRNSGTGLLVSERIMFGVNGIEPQYHKCLDYRMPDAHEHYRALLTAVARLAGADRAGRLPKDAAAGFPTEQQVAGVGQRPSPGKLPRRLAQLAEFCRRCPALLPEHVRTERFMTRFAEQAAEFVAREFDIWRLLRSDPDHIALCHWNANVDNAWFWRDTGGDLHCGLMDWGCVSRMNVAMAIWGALSGAETDLWNRHLDDLLGLFVTEVYHSGGPRLDPRRLADQLMLYVGIMGVTWLLDVPALILTRFGESATELTRTDPRIESDESVRAPLRMLTNVLELWHAHDFGARLHDAISAPTSHHR